MRRMRLAAMIALTLSSAALGSPIPVPDPTTIPNGESLVVDSATKAYYDVRGSLNIRPGAVVSMVSNFNDPTGTVTMSGGTIANGINLNRGLFVSTGGEVDGGYSAGLDVLWAEARIAGGTFIGGDSTRQAGSAVVASAGTWDGVPYLSTVSISGGTFIGGTGSGGYYGGTTGYSLLSIGNTTVAGGQFLSPIAINSMYGGVTSFYGTGLSYDAATHTLSGILQDGDAIQTLVYSTAGTVAKVLGDGNEITFSYDPDAASNPPTGPTTPEPPPVPEPTSLVVFGLAGAFALAYRRRDRS